MSRREHMIDEAVRRSISRQTMQRLIDRAAIGEDKWVERQEDNYRRRRAKGKTAAIESFWSFLERQYPGRIKAVRAEFRRLAAE